MVKVYKHFNRPYEIFLGLSLSKIVQIIFLTGILIWLFINLGLSPKNPLSIMLLIPWILTTVIIIKSDDDYYIKLLTHPFQDHIYLINKESKRYPCFNDLIDIKHIQDNILYKEDHSLASIINIKHGLSIQNLSIEERENLLETWSSFIGQYNKISNFDDYFANLLDKEQIEIFIHIKKDSLEANYYIVVHQEALNENKSKLERFITKLGQRLNLIKPENNYIHNKEICLLEEKLSYTENYFNSLKLETQRLDKEQIKELLAKQIDIFSTKGKIHDKGSHLELKENNTTKYLKSYSLKQTPDSGELDFWLKELMLRIRSEAFISIKFEYRDPERDRKYAESKASILSELKKAGKASTQSVIQDNKALSEKLIDKPYSFNLSINLNFKLDTIDELKELDRIIKKPIKNCNWSTENRKQIEALLSSQITSKRATHKHYADIDFATANFCFFSSNFPKDTKHYIGKSLTDFNTINLNEANKKLHKTRSINFIGDSGSGKSLLAKTMLKKRLQMIDNEFFIIDNSKDGWRDFSLSLGGEVVDLNEIIMSGSYFNPFYFEDNVDKITLSKRIQSLLNFFNALCEQEKLNLEDKDFLARSLRAFFLKKQRACLSDLYLFWSTWEQRELAIKWQGLIAPYCHITNGAYAYLLDGKPRSYLNKLELFQFSTINQEKSFSNICFYLINTELEKKALGENKKLTLVIDEAWRLMQSKKAQTFLSYYARAGRAMECALWTISQKPSDLSKEVYSSASVNICFHLKEKTDQEKLKSLVGFEEHELTLFRNSLLKARGNCIIKTTYGTDLVKVEVNKEEALICSSDKEFSKQRQELRMQG
jgi:ABC-type dipeptide/oligopeptide/nickel transport system ATPase component